MLQEFGPKHEDPDLGLHDLTEAVQQQQLEGIYYICPHKALPRGHLMTYPYEVSREGNVEVLSECEEFPDLGGVLSGKPAVGWYPTPSLSERKAQCNLKKEMFVCQSVGCIASIVLNVGRCLPF